MKKLLSIILLLALATTLFAGCGAETAGENEIGIGINYELSGEVASYGQASVEGIELAIEEINAAGGINGKLIKAFKYDNKSDKSQATTLARKLMTQHKVVAVLGPATSGSFKATIPEAIKNKVVVASGSATDDAVTVDKAESRNMLSVYVLLTVIREQLWQTLPLTTCQLPRLSFSWIMQATMPKVLPQTLQLHLSLPAAR